MTTPARLTLDTLPWPVATTRSPYEIVQLAREVHKRNEEVLRRYGMADLRLQDPDGPGLRHPLPEETMRNLTYIYRDWVPVNLWDRWRQVYVPHPTMTNELLRAGADAFPSELLRGVRNRNPMTVLPAGVPVTLLDGSPGVVRMFTVCGGLTNSKSRHDKATMLVDSDDERTDKLSLHVMTEVLDKPRTKVIDVDWTHLFLPIGGTVTLAELREQSMCGFTTDESTARLPEVLDTLFGICVPHLLYAASERPEIGSPDPDLGGAPAYRGKRQGGSISYMPVGFRLGAAVDAARARSGRPSSEPTGRTVAPHVRAPHFHTYRVGKGRQDTILKFLSSIEINADKIGPNGPDVALHKMGKGRS